MRPNAIPSSYHLADTEVSASTNLVRDGVAEKSDL